MMKLDAAFYQHDLCFDAERLRREVNELPEQCWITHPEGHVASTSLPLIAVAGSVNDDFAIAGQMRPTAALSACAYLQQVLAALEIPVSRSRLMRVAGEANVPKHRDLNYHWYRRTRVHIPLVTHPSVKFTCGGLSVHMSAGQTWTFDNFRSHEVINPHERPRIHLVIDTRGSESFWQRTRALPPDRDASELRFFDYRPHWRPSLILEPYRFEVLTPAEMDELCGHIESVIVGDQKLNVDLQTFRFQWRDAFERYGHDRAGEMEYAALISGLRRELAECPLYGDAEAARDVISTMLTTTNRNGSFQPAACTPDVPRPAVAHNMNWALHYRRTPAASAAVLPGSTFTRILEAFCRPITPRRAWEDANWDTPRVAEQFAEVVGRLVALRLLEPVVRFDRPLFIVSAPRSGSTLLFETLSQVRGVWTVGDECHRTVESIPGLHPRCRNWTSNRLTADNATPEIGSALQARFTQRLRDRDDRSVLDTAMVDSGDPVRLLAKTPKDALRIPFLKVVFPDAYFVYLYREPHESISSIMDGWRSRRFVPYANLPQWPSMPWSFLLPPGWRDYRQASLAEIAAFQWKSANEYILQDLNNLSASDWQLVRYSEFVGDPAREILRLCSFAEWRVDDRLREYLARPLPLARYTLSEPNPEKWRKNESDVQCVLPAVQCIIDRFEEVVHAE